MPRDCKTDLDNRCRDHDGQIRQKSGATRVDRLRRIYGSDFASGVRGDMKLDTLLDLTGTSSLTQFRKRFKY